jgi:hypothetical protein
MCDSKHNCGPRATVRLEIISWRSCDLAFSPVPRHAWNRAAVGEKVPTERPDSCLLVVNGAQAGDATSLTVKICSRKHRCNRMLKGT